VPDLATIDAVVALRFATQGLTGSPFATPAEAVGTLAAVQAQDFSGAKWSLGLRTGWTDAAITQAFDKGVLLRTHVLRPTWHFVLPADIRWMLALTAPKVLAQSAGLHRQEGLDARVFLQAEAVFERALAAGSHLTRPELGARLAEAGIAADKLRLTLIVMHAELVGLICSGPVRGKQQTYALLDDRAPDGPRFERDEALAMLAARFFSGHGPASVRDFARWSGLTLTQARAGLGETAKGLQSIRHDGETLWFRDMGRSAQPNAPPAFLIPEYDEVVLTYPDLNIPGLGGGSPERPDFPSRPVVVGGQSLGTWRRTVVRHAVAVEVHPSAALGPAEAAAITAAVEAYGAFMALHADWQAR